jgi:hypothetical protein
MTTSATAASDARALAEEARRLADAEPGRARELALRARQSAMAAADASTASLAERVLGLASLEMGHIDGACRHLRRAVRIAEGAGLAARAAEAHGTLMRALAERGDVRGTLEQADMAAAGLRGTDLARLLIARSIALERLGRVEACVAGYGRALGIARRLGDRRLEATGLVNRGLAHVSLSGDLSAAEADLLRAECLFEALGAPGPLAKVRHNLAIVAARLGDAPRALALLDGAEELFAERGMRLDRAIVPRDRCAVLLSVRLVPEARAAAERAVQELGAVGAWATRAEALLLLAESLLLERDPAGARRVADEAVRALSRQRRRSWAAMARLVSARAAWAVGARSPQAVVATRRLRLALHEFGFRASAVEASLIAARMALDLGRTRLATRELALAAGARRSGLADRRARAWHAEALLRLSRGDRRGAKAALRAGLGAMERVRASLGASELRAHAAGLGDEVAALGLRLALQEHRPRQVLAWAERWRAGSLWLRPARPPDDAALAADLAELRQLTARMERAALAQEPTDELRRARVAAEERIVRRSRAAAGDGARAARPTVDGVIEALGDRVLLELVEIDGSMVGLVVAGGRVAMRELGGLDQVRLEHEALRFGLRRLALARGSPASLAAARASVTHACERVEELVIGPVRRTIGDRPLVVVPTGALHALPWAALPCCAGRPVVVAPSAALWLRAERRASPGTGAVALVAGPALPGAADEVARLARGYPGARRLTGRRATADAARAALDGAALAHVAAHGSYRADNPLFSSLRLADGELTVYDLERLRRAPATIVLSACDSGLSGVRPGDELTGLAAALLSMGARCLVAGVGLAPDRATRPLMLDFHRRLRAGAGPAEALAGAQAAAGAGGADPDAALAARAAFVCVGSG